MNKDLEELDDMYKMGEITQKQYQNAYDQWHKDND